jgi:alkylhydroperoxidase/carboxymuconolactone decarboxylase family protein YurZ
MRFLYENGSKPEGVAAMARPWFFEVVRKNDPDFVRVLETDLDFVMREGAIPAKYKLLMTMVVDALLAHDAGVATIADRARAAGAGEDEIKEAVRIAYLYGGTPALVSALNAFKKETPAASARDQV